MMIKATGGHRLVLVGGGHTNAQVMLALAQRPEPRLVVTLVTERLTTPYSGMLPGHVAGFYTAQQMHIDLARLARVTGTHLVQGSATGIDLLSRTVLLRDGAVAYDTLVLNVGITPDLSGIDGADQHAIAIKPISGFLARLDAFLAAAGRPDGPRRVVVIGGGAAGVEIALALRTRLDALLGQPSPFWIGLLAGNGVLSDAGAGMQRRVMAALARRRVTVLDDFRASGVNANGVRATDGRFIAADAAFIATAARAPGWLANTGLPLADDGSVLTERTLAVIGHEDVFAVGDCGVVREDPRPKAGVYAVRQASTLDANIRRRMKGLPLQRHVAQRSHLAIIATGDGSAIAGRGSWPTFEGRWVWRWKDDIDRRFMAQFSGFRGSER